MNTTPAPTRLTFAQWARIVAGHIKDSDLESFQLWPVVSQYLSWKRDEKKASVETIREYRAALARLVALCDKPARDVVVADLRAARGTFVEGRHHTVTAAFRDCFKWLYEEEFIDVNPAGRLRYPPRRQKPITDLFSDEEKLAIVTAQTDVMDRVGVLLFFRAGLRKAELRHLRVQDVNLIEKYILVRRGKGGKFRTVPVRGEVIRALEELFLTDVTGLGRPRLPDEYLMAPWSNRHRVRRCPDRPMSDRGAHNWWYECLVRAGLVVEGTTSGRRMHASRHTYATDLGRATNWNMLAVQKNLGHADISLTTGTYTQFALEDQAAAVEQLPEITTS